MLNTLIKRLLAVVIVGSVVALTLAAGFNSAVAGGMWSAWLYSFETNRVARVYADGSAETFDLDLPPGANISSSPVFSSAGNWAAYCIQNSGAKNTSSLRVQDLYNDGMAEAYNVTFPVMVDFGPIVGCDLSPAAFNTFDDSKVAVSVVYNFPGDPNANPAERPLWELLIVDLASQQIVARLNPQSPAIAPLSSIDPSLPFLARVLAFEGSQITFRLEPFASGGWFEAPTYVWQIGNDSFERGESLYQHNGLDTIGLTDKMGMITANEAIWLGSNPDLPPAKDPMAPFDPPNLVMYTDGKSEPYPILHQPGYLHNPTFVNGALHVAALVATQTGSQWIAVDRSGATMDLPASDRAAWLVDAPGGYAYLEVNADTGQEASLHHHQFADDGSITDRLLWQDASAAWVLVWHQPLSGMSGLAPFPPLTF